MIKLYIFTYNDKINSNAKGYITDKLMLFEISLKYCDMLNTFHTEQENFS